MRIRSLVFSTLLFAGSQAAAQPPSRLDPVLSPGQSLGTGLESHFRRLGALARNSLGQMLFLASYCPLPTPGQTCQEVSGLFLRDPAGNIQALIDDQSRPEGFSLDPAAIVQLTDSGHILLAQRDGILRFQEGAFRWLVRQGGITSIPSFQGTSVFFDQFRVSERFGREDGNIAFAASLSNGSSGVFETDGDSFRLILLEGDALPAGGTSTVAGGLAHSRPVAAGRFTAFVAGTGHPQLFLDDGANWQLILQRGDPMGNAVVRSLGNLDLNPGGMLVFEAGYQEASGGRDSDLLLFQGGELVPLTAGRPLPGLPGLPISRFEGPYLTGSSEIFFGVLLQDGPGAIYCWRAGRLTKIAADGDALAGGGNLQVTLHHEINIPEPPTPTSFQRLARPQSGGMLAFQARIAPRGSDTTLIWRDGSLEVLELNGGLLPGSDRHLVESLEPLLSDRASQVVVRARLCCDSFREAILLSGNTATTRRYLPFLVEGDYPGGISFVTQLRSANPGRYTALDETTVIAEGPLVGTTVRPPVREALGAGLVSQKDSWASPGNGFLRIDSLQGGPTRSFGVIRLSEHDSLASQTALETQIPLTGARVVVDTQGGGQVGVAVSSPDGEARNIAWELLDGSGKPVGSGIIRLQETVQKALLVDDLVGGLPEPFLGALQLQSAQPFLANGLRLNGLRLSTIPVQPSLPAPPRFGLALVLPDQPHPELGQKPRQILSGPSDELAIVTPDRQLHLITADGQRVLFGPGHPLEEAEFSEAFPSEIGLIEFDERGLLFFLAAGVGWPGLFSWDGSQVQRLIRNGDPDVDGGEVVMGSFPEEFGVNRAGQIALGINALFLRQPDGEIRRILSETDQLPAGVDSYGRIVSVDINERGAIGFASDRAIGLVDAQGIRIVARVGEAIGNDFSPEAFQRVRLTSDGHLYFLATSSYVLAIPHSPLRLPLSGLFFFDGEAVHPMLVSGDPVSADGQVSVSQVSQPNPAPDSPVPILLNRQDRLAAFASLVGTSSATTFGGFFLLANTTARPQLLVGDSRIDPNSPLAIPSAPGDFGWNERGELLLAAQLPRFQSGLFERLPGGELETIRREGDRIDDSDGSRPEVLRSLGRVWGLSESGAALFGALVAPDFRTGTYLARPDGFHQLWVPHLVSGEFEGIHFSSTLLVHNSGQTDVELQVRLFAPSAERVGEVSELALGPGQTQRLDLAFPTPLAGWARVDIRRGTVGIFLRLAVRDSFGISSELTIPAVPASRSALWQARAHSFQNLDTGLALVNTGSTDCEVLIERLGEGRVPLQSRLLQLGPGGYRAVLLSELFGGGEPGFPGDSLYRISGSNPLAIVSMEQILGSLTSVPLVFN